MIDFVSYDLDSHNSQNSQNSWIRSSKYGYIYIYIIHLGSMVILSLGLAEVGHCIRRLIDFNFGCIQPTVCDII